MRRAASYALILLSIMIIATIAFTPHALTFLLSVSPREWFLVSLYPLVTLFVTVVARLVLYKGNPKALHSTILLASIGVSSWVVASALALHWLTR
jgi:hypothetical protein